MRILLIVGGGIAAYKCLELIRHLKRDGIGVTSILTPAGAEFVTPLSLAALSGEKVYTDLFSLTDEVEMGHIELSRSADLLVVAPATADLLARMAAGQANDLATTALLATDKPVLAAPAMNVRMWEHPATRRNLACLEGDGIAFVGPDEGDMACGEYGFGRMAEPVEIAREIRSLLSPAETRPLSGKRVIVTAGPTYEPVDPVRFLGNRSSGLQGYAIARALAAAGADTVLISGPTALQPPAGVHLERVETAREMLAAVEKALPADVMISAAAVADWRPEESASQKIKKQSGDIPAIRLAENPDILATVSRAASRPGLVIGFAAETENLRRNAKCKLERKKCDWIVANDVSADAGTFGGSENSIHLVTRSDAEDWPKMSKDAVAERLVARIVSALHEGSEN